MNKDSRGKFQIEQCICRPNPPVAFRASDWKHESLANLQRHLSRLERAGDAIFESNVDRSIRHNETSNNGNSQARDGGNNCIVPAGVVVDHRRLDFGNVDTDTAAASYVRHVLVFVLEARV